MGSMGWVPSVETKGSRGMGFSSMAWPLAGQLLWASWARPQDCRSDGEWGGTQRAPEWPVWPGSPSWERVRL